MIKMVWQEMRMVMSKEFIKLSILLLAWIITYLSLYISIGYLSI